MIRGGYIAAVMAILGAVWLYGIRQHHKGVTDATNAFIEADRKGANNAREVAREVLRTIGNVDDPDELLRETNGLRD